MYRTSTFQYQKCFKIKYCSKSARKLVCCVAQFIFLAQYCGITVIANILPGFFLSVYHCTVYSIPSRTGSWSCTKNANIQEFFLSVYHCIPSRTGSLSCKKCKCSGFFGAFSPSFSLLLLFPRDSYHSTSL